MPNGILIIAPQENCSTARIWFRVRVRIKIRGAIFLGGNCPRTISNIYTAYLLRKFGPKI